MLSPIDFISKSSTSHVLVVDDEAHIRQPISQALISLGYAVRQAGSGTEALDLLQHATFDLMLLDMQMPDFDGIELMEQARQIQTELLIVVLTGHPTLDNAIASVKYEVADYLRKPTTINEVAETIAGVLRKNAKRVQRERAVDFMAEVLDTLRHAEDTPLPDAPPQLPQHIIQTGPVLLNRETLRVTIQEPQDAQDAQPRSIDITEGEAAVLAVLMSHPNQIFTCTELVQAAFQYKADEPAAQSVIRPHIFRLRRKLEKNPASPCYIQTIRGRGYTFSQP